MTEIVGVTGVKGQRIGIPAAKITGFIEQDGWYVLENFDDVSKLVKAATA
jgi:hypothetical protein